MAEINKSELLSSFVSITGAEKDRAEFCLSAAEWDLPNAIEIFYQSADDPEDSVSAPQAAAAAAPQQAAPAPAPAPATKSQKSASRIATIGSMRKEEEDSDSGEEGQAFYTGGSEHGGGQQILGPRRKKKPDSDGLIKDMFSAAKEHGAEEVAAGPSSGSRAPGTRFQGSGYRLGETEGDSERITGTVPSQPRQVDMVLKLWKNGFSVNDGELRDFHDPQNQQFLEAIKKGEVPQELISQARGGEVNLNMEDHREEEFVAPKKTVKAFAGEGNRLGSAAPTVVSTASRSEEQASEDAAKSAVSVDLTQPTTQIQIRLADGSRLVAKFNHTHKVSDIRQFIISARPQFAVSTFVLMTTFPNCELTEDSQSIADAKLLNAVIMQRLK